MHGDRAFSSSTPKLWNNIPKDIKSVESVHTFMGLDDSQDNFNTHQLSKPNRIINYENINLVRKPKADFTHFLINVSYQSQRNLPE